MALCCVSPDAKNLNPLGPAPRSSEEKVAIKRLEGLGMPPREDEAAKTFWGRRSPGSDFNTYLLLAGASQLASPFPGEISKTSSPFSKDTNHSHPLSLVRRWRLWIMSRYTQKEGVDKASDVGRSHLLACALERAWNQSRPKTPLNSAARKCNQEKHQRG